MEAQNVPDSEVSVLRLGGYVWVVSSLGRRGHQDHGDLTPPFQLNNLLGLHIQVIVAVRVANLICDSEHFQPILGRNVCPTGARPDLKTRDIDY